MRWRCKNFSLRCRALALTSTQTFASSSAILTIDWRHHSRSLTILMSETWQSIGSQQKTNWLRLKKKVTIQAMLKCQSHSFHLTRCLLARSHMWIRKIRHLVTVIASFSRKIQLSSILLISTNVITMHMEVTIDLCNSESRCKTLVNLSTKTYRV